MDEVAFFQFTDPLATRPMRLRGIYSELGDEVQDVFTGKTLPQKAVNLTASMGGSEADVLWCEYVPCCVIATRVRDLLRDHQVAGWLTYPVEVHGRNGEAIKGYHGLAVTGPEVRSQLKQATRVVNLIPTMGRYEVYRGFDFVRKDWDGSDVFRSKGLILTTKKVHDLFAQQRITNVRFVPLDQVETLAP
jgi:hypothetical protein